MRRETDHKKGGKLGDGNIVNVPYIGELFPSSHPQLPGFLALLRFNMRTLLKPWSLFLLAVSALSSYYAVYISFHPYSAGGSPLPWADTIALLVSEKGTIGLNPLFLMISYHTLPWVIGGFTAFMLTGGIAIVYTVACNLVTEDSGCLPRNLLHSRPISRTAFLLTGFMIRFIIFVVLGYMLPFVVAYAQNVADIGASAQPVIANYVTIEQWYTMAWDSLVWQYLAIFVTYIFTLTSLGLLLSVATRRGLTGILVGVLLIYLTSYAAWQIAGDYITSGTILGGRQSFPAFMVLMPAFYLVAAIDSTPGFEWKLQAPVFSLSTGMWLLILYGGILLALSAIAYKRRGGAE